MGAMAALCGPAAADNDEDGDESRILAHPTFEIYADEAPDACVSGALQIRVSLTNVFAHGIVKLDVYGGDPDLFLEKKGKLRKVRVPAAPAPQRICIDVPAPGTYAVTSYHDLDADRDLDKKWNFKPKEPYGMSNNVEIKELRLPKFSEAAFDVPAAGADIDLVYYGKKAGRPDKVKDFDGDDMRDAHDGADDDS